MAGQTSTECVNDDYEVLTTTGVDSSPNKGSRRVLSGSQRAMGGMMSPLSSSIIKVRTAVTGGGGSSNGGGRRMPMRDKSRESLREEMLTVQAGSDEYRMPGKRAVSGEASTATEEESLLVEESAAPLMPQQRQQNHCRGGGGGGGGGGARRLVRRLWAPHNEPGDNDNQRERSWDSASSSHCGGSVGRTRYGGNDNGYLLSDNKRGGSKRGGGIMGLGRSGGSHYHSSSSSSVPPVVLVMICALLSMGAAYKLFMNFVTRREVQIRKSILDEELAAIRKEMQAKLQQAEGDAVTLNEKLRDAQSGAAALRQQLAVAQNDKSDREKYHKQIDELYLYQGKMHNGMQTLSRNLLLHAFGPGPHYVEIQLEIDPRSNIASPLQFENRAKLVVEMAPADVMPHAVFWFLEQVSRKLFDGCSFDRYADHVLQANPTHNFATDRSKGRVDDLHKRFMDAGFYSVLFQEYSDQYPHKEYTLGYSGRPGGPQFYINLEDNTVDHAPNGQVTELGNPDHEGDPAFAKVIEGFDVIDRMKKSALQPGGYHLMKHAVAIKSMSIVTRFGNSQFN